MSDSERGESAGGFLLGVVIGTLLGVGIGFLYAPKPGQESRHYLKEKVTELVENAREAVGMRLLGISEPPGDI